MINIFSIENKKAIAISSVSTVIFIYFIQPILTFLGNLGLFIVRIISDTLYNRLFEEIALGKPDYAFVLFVLLFAFLFISIFLLAITPKLKNRKYENNNDLVSE